jgi:hypothetical protein
MVFKIVPTWWWIKLLMRGLFVRCYMMIVVEMKLSSARIVYENVTDMTAVEK